MAKVDIDVEASSVEVSAGNYEKVNVRLIGAESSDVMNSLSIDDVVEHFGAKYLLDEIGEQEARNHFGITED